MYTVYILKSQKDGKHYIGATADVKRRLESHNQGGTVSTRHRAPFELIYQKEFLDKASALHYERWLKKQKGGITVKALIKKYQEANGRISK